VGGQDRSQTAQTGNECDVGQVMVAEESNHCGVDQEREWCVGYDEVTVGQFTRSDARGMLYHIREVPQNSYALSVPVNGRCGT
jgi:hypothetical protein